MNPYDMREKCVVPPLCYDFSNVQKYLQRDDVRKILGARGRWADCSKAVTVRFELSGDYLKNYQQLLPELLEAGVRMLIYAGDQDFICTAAVSLDT
jgi:cathepsin A (carboxypeptidase C)